MREQKSYLQEIAEEYEGWKNKGPEIKRAQPKIYLKGFTPEQVYHQIKRPTEMAIEEAKELLAAEQMRVDDTQPACAELSSGEGEEEEVAEESSAKEKDAEVEDDEQSEEKSGLMEEENDGDEGEGEAVCEESELDDEDDEDMETIREYMEGNFESDSDPLAEEAAETLRKLDKKI